MSPTPPDQLLADWLREAATPFSGWDFSHLHGRMTEAEPPWSYPALARAAIAQAHDILDMATGGGEVFASLAPFPGRATAVEGHAPNLPIARHPSACGCSRPARARECRSRLAPSTSCSTATAGSRRPRSAGS